MLYKSDYVCALNSTTECCHNPATLDDLRAAAKELGMVVVPIDPTDAMLCAADIHEMSLFESYKAMTTAAQEEV